jgi:hypothetical protein
LAIPDVPVHLQQGTSTLPPGHAPFLWNDTPEPNQAADASGYLAYIRRVFVSGFRALDVARLDQWRGDNSLWQLLLSDGTEVRGTADAVIFLRGQRPASLGEVQSLVRSTAIVYFELGKPVTSAGGLYGKKERQAKLEAVCARLTIRDDGLCPILVVTDLQDDWTILWLQAAEHGSNLELRIFKCTTAEALQEIRSVLQVIDGSFLELPALTAKERMLRTRPAANDHPLHKRFKELPKPDVGDLSDVSTPEEQLLAYRQELYARMVRQKFEAQNK